VGVNDRRLARIVKACRDLPGQDLFQYIDDNNVRQDVNSADVNAYLKEITGEDFTAKDFRTWSGTVLAWTALQEREAASMAQAKKHVLQAIEAVAGVLGNTRSVCRKSYIHPAIIDSYMDGSMKQAGKRGGAEVAVLAILRRRVKAFPRQESRLVRAGGAERLHRYDRVLCERRPRHFSLRLAPGGCVVAVFRINLRLVLDLHVRIFVARLDHDRGELHPMADVR
jgi:DNA topoisomerase IB